jgi:glycosyltransferase involved in cell wall biosynthesis
LDQTFLDFELVVIANGSAAKDIASAVRKWAGYDPRMSVFTTEVRHLNFSLSLGLHHTRAPLVARMDADDIMLPNRLLIQSRYLNDNPEISILGTQVKHIDERGIEIEGRNSYVVGQENLRTALLHGCELAHPTVMFRKNIVQKLSGYRKQFQYAEDYDLWLRAREITQIDNLAEVLLLYRLHSNQSSNVYTSEQTIATRAAIISSKIRANEIHADSDCPEANQTLSDWVSKISLKLPEYSETYKFRELIKFNGSQKRTMHDLLWASARSNSRLGMKKFLPYIIKAFAIRPLNTMIKVFKIVARRIFFDLREKHKKDV